jgi:tetratricopeptide (TPR) repeat protein
MAAAVAVLLAIGATVFIRQTRIEQRRFEDARRLINAVVQEIQPKLESIPATLPLRQVLIERTMTYLESVSRDAGNNVELLRELANAYAQLARVQGDVTTSSLGNQGDAAARFARADELMQKAAAVAPRNPAVLKDAALFYGRLASFENTQGRVSESVTHARLAVDFAERNQAARPGEFDAREVLAFSVFYLGTALPAAEWDVRVSTFQRAGDLYRGLASERPDKDNLLRNAAIADRHLASLHHDRGRTIEARTFGERALAASERRLTSQPRAPSLQLEVAADAGVLGAILVSAGDLDASRARFERAIALDEAILGADPANARAKILLAEAARGLAQNRLRAGDTADARRYVTRSLGVFDSLRQAGQFPNAVMWRFAAAAATLADVEHAEGRSGPACDAYGRAVAAFDASHRQSPLVDLVKADADRARMQLAQCPAVRTQ